MTRIVAATQAQSLKERTKPPLCNCRMLPIQKNLNLSRYWIFSVVEMRERWNGDRLNGSQLSLRVYFRFRATTAADEKKITTMNHKRYLVYR